MNERDYQIPNVYPVNLDEKTPYASFGLPESVLQQSAYADSDYELLRFLNYGSISRLQDAETGQAYRLLAKNINGVTLDQGLQSAQSLLHETTSAVRNVIGEIVDAPLGKGNYWRYLVNFPDSEIVGLEGVKLKLIPKVESAYGPHAALNHREKRAILRVKASTLEQLNELFEQVKSILV